MKNDNILIQDIVLFSEFLMKSKKAKAEKSKSKKAGKNQPRKEQKNQLICQMICQMIQVLY